MKKNINTFLPLIALSYQFRSMRKRLNIGEPFSQSKRITMVAEPALLLIKPHASSLLIN